MKNRTRYRVVAGLFCAILLTVPQSLKAQANEEIKKSTGQNLKTTVGEEEKFQDSEFKNETRAGMILATGNTESFSFSASDLTKYRYKRFENTWRLGSYYSHVSTGPATGTLAKYIYGTYRLDYYFLPMTTVFVGGGGYTDEIKGINVAGSGFGGLTHYLFKQKNRDLSLSLGYDFTREDRIAPALDESIHSATQGLFYREEINSYVNFIETLTAFENMKHGSDMRLLSESSLKVKLTQHLSFVTSYVLRFDNEPVPGLKKLDTLLDVALALTF
ncbi:MAG: DUF481 domain-containing protein [Deltaproteobacteria bacterium]|nr:MAG: DUF481 domain-containing protein [Deltaproteobacteria bacterium]